MSSAEIIYPYAPQPVASFPGINGQVFTVTGVLVDGTVNTITYPTAFLTAVTGATFTVQEASDLNNILSAPQIIGTPGLTSLQLQIGGAPAGTTVTLLCTVFGS